MLRRERLARQPVLAHELGGPLRRFSGLGEDEAQRQTVSGGAADDPLEPRIRKRRSRAQSSRSEANPPAAADPSRGSVPTAERAARYGASDTASHTFFLGCWWLV